MALGTLCRQRILIGPSALCRAFVGRQLIIRPTRGNCIFCTTLRYITEERFGSTFSAPQFIIIFCRAVNRSGGACSYFHPRANARARGEPLSLVLAPGHCSPKLPAAAAQLLRQRQRRQKRQKKKRHFEHTSEQQKTDCMCSALQTDIIFDGFALFDGTSSFALERPLSVSTLPTGSCSRALPPIKCRGATNTEHTHSRGSAMRVRGCATGAGGHGTEDRSVVCLCAAAHDTRPICSLAMPHLQWRCFGD